METQEQSNSTCKGLVVRRVWLVLGPREEQQELCRPQRVQEKTQGPLMEFSWLFWGKTGIHWGKASLKVGETSEWLLGWLELFRSLLLGISRARGVSQ